MLESALGKVLLIDEAYRLADGPFAKEATDELVDLLTKPQFAQKLVVILAGYDREIDGLLAMNPGLTSRFPERVSFQHLSPEYCIQLLVTKLSTEDFLDTTLLSSSISSVSLITALKDLIQLPGWANARDIITLAKKITRERLLSGSSSSKSRIKVCPEHVTDAIIGMLAERRRPVETTKGSSTTSKYHAMRESMMSFESAPKQKPPSQAATSIDRSEAPSVNVENPGYSDSGRDAGVTDETWSALEDDKQRADHKEQHYTELTEECAKIAKNVSEMEEDHSDGGLGGDDSDIKKARLKREQERIRYEQLSTLR